MKTTSILKTLRKGLCLLLSTSLLVTSTLPGTVSAQVVSCDAYLADSGSDPRCIGKRIQGVPVAAPKLQWTRLTDMPTTPLTGAQNVVHGGSEAVNLANKAAVALTNSGLPLKPSELASMVVAFPSNVPYVFARYNHMDSTLRIDVFKLERDVQGTQSRAGLYHATFGPSHGDMWKLNRAYISPDAYKAGQMGVNPFTAFAEAGSDKFVNISLNGAMVAVGHAMRMTGAPLGMFSTAHERLSQTVTKGGNAFVKKTTIRTFGHAKPRWFIVQPHQMLQRSTSSAESAFCARDPGADSCPRYEMAAAGVGFEEFDGGTLSDYEDEWLLHTDTKRGLGFLGALVLAVIGSFAIAGLMAAAGIGAGAAAGGAAAATGATGVSMGTMGSFLVGAGAITPFGSTLAAIGFEAAITAASMVMAGANLGSTINMNAGVLLGIVSVQKGIASTVNLSEMQGLLNQRLGPALMSDMSKGPNSLTGFDRTVMGGCSPGTQNCAINAGMIQRVQQYTEMNEVQFMRDNNGFLLRSNSDPAHGNPLGGQQ